MKWIAITWLLLSLTIIGIRLFANTWLNELTWLAMGSLVIAVPLMVFEIIGFLVCMRAVQDSIKNKKRVYKG